MYLLCWLFFPVLLIWGPYIVTQILFEITLLPVGPTVTWISDGQVGPPILLYTSVSSVSTVQIIVVCSNKIYYKLLKSEEVIAGILCSSLVWLSTAQMMWIILGSGGGSAQQSFRGCSTQGPMYPSPFYILFLTEKVPLSYTFHGFEHCQSLLTALNTLSF